MLRQLDPIQLMSRGRLVIFILRSINTLASMQQPQYSRGCLKMLNLTAILPS
jgi:hypothetical protein